MAFPRMVKFVHRGVLAKPHGVSVTETAELINGLRGNEQIKRLLLALSELCDELTPISVVREYYGIKLTQLTGAWYVGDYADERRSLSIITIIFP